MSIEFGASTHVGMVREKNEDSFAYGDNYAVVADGMGGHNKGEVASKITTDTFVENFSGFSGDDYEQLLKETINLSNKRVFELSVENPEMQGMGTTVIACVWNEKNVYVANVGDSRCYLINKKNISQVSVDHSYVQLLVSQGKITAEEAKLRKDKNLIMRAVGSESEVEADIFKLERKKDDIILLCSDGLTNMIEDKDIIKCLNKQGSMQDKADKLVSLANKNGGKDNITVVILKFVD